MIKILLFSVLFSLGSKASVEVFDNLMNRHFEVNRSKGDDVVGQRMEIDDRVRALNLESIDVPARTYQFVQSKRQSLIKDGEVGYIGSTDLPTSLYQVGPPRYFRKLWI